MNQNLWYDEDEVGNFHPHVEECLKKAIEALTLGEELDIIHHADISGTSTVPDFIIVLKRNQQSIFVLEVKKTKQSVESERSWIQTDGYVSALSYQWANVPKYFAITNLEELLVFVKRNEHVTRCLLQGNPIRHGDFDLNNPVKLAEIKSNLTNTLKSLIGNAYAGVRPVFSDNWSLLIDSFYSTYDHVYQNLRGTDKIKNRDISLHELLRLLFYYYLKSAYGSCGHANRSVFQNINIKSTTSAQFMSSLLSNFQRVLGIDFKQIFSDYPKPQEGIIPNNLTTDQIDQFERLINKLQTYSDVAFQENPSASIFFNLLTDKLYTREELHNEGKIMSDRELSNLLTELTIEREDDEIIDPGSGDGALLDAAYDRLFLLSQKNNRVKTHNQILSQMHGYEIDSFLNQLATFRLLTKNLGAIDQSSAVDLNADDVFLNPGPSKFDVVLMNPPFLRNDDPNTPLSQERKHFMIEAIRSVSGSSFVENAAQPNLYFYFIDWIMHYLKPGGRAGIILMAKFMNNLDGALIKEYFKNHVESIIVYPKDYFVGFRVTTAIVILRKDSTKTDVKFLRIINSKLLEDPQIVSSILDKEHIDNINADFTLKVVDRCHLDENSNWRLYLIDPQNNFSKLDSIEILSNLSNFFGEIQRGSADNSGGSKTVFLNDKDELSRYFNLIETYVGYGFQNNKKRRSPIVKREEFELEKAIHFPTPFDELNKASADLALFSKHAMEKYGEGSWKEIVNSAHRSKVTPDLIIPRAEREKHSAYLIEGLEKIVISTNFFYCSGLRKLGDLTRIESLGVITAYLISSFGQVQFELVANNQEGLRKLEKFMIEKIKVIDPSRLTRSEVESISSELRVFNKLKVNVRGDEGVNGPRRNLDMAISKAILSHTTIGFKSAEELTNFVELFLEELVRDRQSQS